ncbi:glycerol-3-phosphate 1-O-acyltransferase PlsY [Endomicrobium proavitum]|uniref:Glycerol-3-phosphate acyltransferase n=1 Tax=Endomicrobium proavitum TaxID=1408281 RepID=A0A0G3WK95_9BACT|nr:glycerol-3-phosphate 1-O-acyltransferase PlsY [Endomicrobium proavitum]AKL97919.1 Glycerol-3-phosphate acyltransferase [Endomicrobium proavitum]
MFIINEGIVFMTTKILYVVLTYLCGSIPFAYIIAKLAAGIDIRTAGSGNPGATNVFRTVGAGAGSVTFILDAAKGFLPVFLARIIFDNPSFYYLVAVAAAAMTGHMFTVFLKFKGGKGVATGCGVFLALMPLPAAYALIVFALVFLCSGYVALGSVFAAASLPISAIISKSYSVEYVVFAFFAAALVIYKHRENIKRLIAGTEHRFKIFGSGKK